MSKCGVCSKSVYPMDPQVKADGSSYHTNCAKCTECGCQINLNNYAKAEGKLFCKTHFSRKYAKEGGYISPDKLNMRPVEDTGPVEVDKNLKCGACSEAVYPMEPQVKLDGKPYHKSCAKCKDCGCQINLNNFATADGIVYCKVHFQRKYPDGGKAMERRPSERRVSLTTDSTTNSPVEVAKNLRCGCCSNAVYPLEPQVKMHGIPYHQTCAKCSECGCQLSVSNFSRDDTSLYCKVHFQRKYPDGGKTVERRTSLSAAEGGGNSPLEVAKNLRCGACAKAVYAMEPQVKLDGIPYHQSCAKCVDCGCQITLSNFTRDDTTLYCKTHYLRKFHKDGSYAGGDKFRKRGTIISGGIYSSPSADEAAEDVGLDSPPPPFEEDEEEEEVSGVEQYEGKPHVCIPGDEEIVPQASMSAEELSAAIAEEHRTPVNSPSRVDEDDTDANLASSFGYNADAGDSAASLSKPKKLFDM